MKGLAGKGHKRACSKSGRDLSPIVRLLPAPARYHWRYYRVHKRLCNFSNPRTFSEKIYHRMRYPLPEFTRLADKIKVRDYIRERVGDLYNVPLYLDTANPTLADFDHLPDAFVMKSNSGCGHVRIVPDKRLEDLEELTRLARRWLREDFSRHNGERHYAGIRPSILFEKALLDGGKPVADYKIHVFNGADGTSYEFLQIISDRFGRPTQNLYDTNWLELGFKIGGKLPASQATDIVRPPQCLSEMLTVAKTLAQPFGYCRVDFYVYEGRPYVGELTFTPGAGELKFFPQEWDRRLGALFRWPETSPVFVPPVVAPPVTLPKPISQAG